MMSIPAFGFTRAESTLFQQEHRAILFLQNSNCSGHNSMWCIFYLLRTPIVGITGKKIWINGSGTLEVLSGTDRQQLKNNKRSSQRIMLINLCTLTWSEIICYSTQPQRTTEVSDGRGACTGLFRGLKSSFFQSKVKIRKSRCELNQLPITAA